MEKLIQNRIKQLYGTQGNFCKTHGYRQSNFMSKIKTLKNKIKWCDRLLKFLGMRIIIEIDYNYERKIRKIDKTSRTSKEKRK